MRLFMLSGLLGLTSLLIISFDAHLQWFRVYGAPKGYDLSIKGGNDLVSKVIHFCSMSANYDDFLLIYFLFIFLLSCLAYELKKCTGISLGYGANISNLWGK